IFATARTAGWIAHALEEYERDVPIRPRAVYTGPAPTGQTPTGPTSGS
ncbi:MAG TPA: citrate synthase, partial [Actinomycetes bacterium]